MALASGSDSASTSAAWPGGALAFLPELPRPRIAPRPTGVVTLFLHRRNRIQANLNFKSCSVIVWGRCTDWLTMGHGMLEWPTSEPMLPLKRVSPGTYKQ